MDQTLLKELNTKQEKSKISPTRIEDLGEYKINIQLGQMLKNYQYLSDIMIRNP